MSIASTHRRRHERLGLVLVSACALMGLGLLGSAPASAANLLFLTASCGTSATASSSTSGVVGDTITLRNTGTATCSITFIGPNGSGGAASALGPGNLTMTSTVYTLNTPGTNAIVVSGGGFSYTLNVTIGAAPSPASASTTVSYLQQVPVPTSGSCADVKDAAFAWGTDVTGGWTRAWGEWSGSWVCSRFLTNAGGSWSTAAS